MKSNPASKLCAALSILLVFVFCSPLLAADGRFFVRLGTGASVPNLKNLNAELALQKKEKVGAGYGLGVSLGHTFFEERWSLELHFSTAFYPPFDYEPYDPDTTDTNHEYFPAKLRHYTTMLVARHNFMSESARFRPTLGAGIGYGQTNLISGGGKLGALEGLVTGRLDVSIRSNLELALECSYYAGLQAKEFRNPFLENVDTDMVQNSAGDALGDTFRSLDVRIGLTLWLKPVTQ
jgi:outer membrane protein W